MKKTSLHPFIAICLLCFSSIIHAADHINSIGMAFNTIKVASFYMGGCRAKYTCPSKASVDYKAKVNETPQRKVTLSQDFQLGIYEVTLGQFKRYISSSGGEGMVETDFMALNKNGNSAPVVGVSWQDVQKFIAWLNKKEVNNKYRLPTEAEWEYAARAGTDFRYPWGDFHEKSSLYAWYAKNSNNRLHEVGLKKSNPWGLYDMQGNAWEWTGDWYSKTTYKRTPTLGPKGVKIGINRVIRGGRWFNSAKEMRSSARYKAKPNFRNNMIGFRLVREL